MAAVAKSKFFRYGLRATLLIGSLAALFFLQEVIVHLAAPGLFLTESPQKADFIYVLGGDYEVRGQLAARLWKEGWAPRIVIAREADNPEDRENQSDLLTTEIRRFGVPADCILQLRNGNGVRSTADEIRTLRHYLESSRANRVLIATSLFHGRRTRMAAQRALAGTGVAVTVVTADSRLVSQSDWSRTAIGRKTVRLECLKYLYYFVTFWR